MTSEMLTSAFQTSLTELVQTTVMKSLNEKLLRLIDTLSTELKVDKGEVTAIVRKEFQELKVKVQRPQKNADLVVPVVPCTSTIKSGKRKGQQCGKPSAENGLCKVHGRKVDKLPEDVHVPGCTAVIAHGDNSGRVCGKPCKYGTLCGIHFRTKDQSSGKTCNAVLKTAARKGELCGNPCKGDSQLCGRHTKLESHSDTEVSTRQPEEPSAGAQSEPEPVNAAESDREIEVESDTSDEEDNKPILHELPHRRLPKFVNRK